MRVRPIIVVFLIILAGCSGFTPTQQSSNEAPEVNQLPPLQSTDGIGEEDGYSTDSSLSIDQGELNETEIEKIVARTKARVEAIRGLEFNQSISVDLNTRSVSEVTRQGDSAYVQRQNLIHEAIFSVGENTDASAELQRVSQYKSTGLYNRRTNELSLTMESRQLADFNEPTLAHELVHALQDQYGLLPERPDDASLDLDTAHRGFVEGDAQAVMERYEQLCEEDWNCYESEPGEAKDGYNKKVYSMVRFFYTDPTQFVIEKSDGCWCNITSIYDNPPTSTEQLIHPEKYPETYPDSVELPAVESNSISRENWGVRMGEMRVAAMLGNPEIEEHGLQNTEPVVTDERYIQDGEPQFDFSASSGWDGDKLARYSTESGSAYIWRINWASEKDAKGFYSAYKELLQYYDSVSVGTNTWEVKDPRFEDYFTVKIDGGTVTIYNAETESTVRELQSNQNR